MLVAYINLTAHAQPNTQLTPLVITAAKSATPIHQTPARMTVIDKQNIEKTPTHNLDKLLQQDASIYIKQNGGIGQGTNLSLRNTNPQHTLLLKDGVRLNTPNTLTPIYPETLDLTATEQIEILKGAASVQHGSDAIGGVVQLISKIPTKTGSQITALYGENDSHKIIANADLVADNGLYTSFTAQTYHTDGSRIFNTQNTQQKAGYEQQGAFAKLGYDQKNLQTSIAIEQNKGTNHYSDDLGNSNNAKRHFYNRTIIAKTLSKVNDHLTVSAHYGNAKDQQTYAQSYSTNQFISNHDEYDLNAKLTLSNQQELLIGATHQQDNYQDAYAYQGNKQIKTIGYYAQHRYQGKQLNTQLGMRVEDNDTFGTHTVGQTAVRYQPTNTTSLYANIGTAFRAPSLNELYYQSTFRNANTTYHTLGNRKLQPEHSIGYELGIDQQITDNLFMSLSAYQAKINNLITTQSTFSNNTITTTYQNLGKASFTGGEVALKWSNNPYHASINYAHNKSKNEKTGLEIAYRPKQTGTLTMGYDDGTYGLGASLLARSSAKSDNSPNAIKIPAHSTMDIHTHWQALRHVKLFATVQNIGNVEYPSVWNFGNWYVAHGRQTNVGATLTF